ncbi:MAG TPA: hypothetical protein VHZ51_13475 [Ktedonobacteraceae bacterium]|jgi:fatty acid desaturase|nr:hypothetical protein [Ktedonobacteraceae bacterium]
MQQMHPDEQAHYEEGYAGGGQQSTSQPPLYSAYDDNFVEALAQRIVQRQSSNAQGKLYTAQRMSPNPAASRLWIIIVGLVVLIPLAAILVGGVGGIGGIIAFVAACIAVISIVGIYFGMTPNH